MANYIQNKFTQAFDERVATVDLKINVGATGAVASYESDGGFVTSVTKETTAGLYTVALATGTKTFEKVKGFSCAVQGSAGLDDLTFHNLADSVSTASAPTFSIQAHTAGTAANATSGNAIVASVRLSYTEA